MQSIRMKTRLTGRQKNTTHSLTTLANLKSEQHSASTHINTRTVNSTHTVHTHTKARLGIFTVSCYILLFLLVVVPLTITHTFSCARCASRKTSLSLRLQLLSVLLLVEWESFNLLNMLYSNP